jgi:DNA-binding protein YbaB
MQEDLEKSQNELKQKEYTNKTVSSIVKVTMDGDYQVKNVEFGKDFVNNFTNEDFEMLADSIAVAVNEITREITEDKEGAMADLAGSIKIPGLR